MESALAGTLVAVVILCLLNFYFLRQANKKVFNLSLENSQLKDISKELQNNVLTLQEEVGTEREKNRYLLSQKKSSETRLGQISEHLVPFLANCPYNPKNLHFLGNPIDYLVFDFDQGIITFLEVKSGNSKASKRQKTVKNIIKTGRIFYDEIRINEKGVRHRSVPSESFTDEESTKEESDEQQILSQKQEGNTP